MAKVGRNDPCPCGSGKKYKQCHLPIEEAQRAEQLRLRRAADTLIPKIVEQAGAMTDVLGPALERYWNGKYQPDQLAELDTLEDRGAERFLIWLAFDHRLEDGTTLITRLIADPSTLDLTPHEAALLPGWETTRLGAYLVESIEKGQSLHVRDLLSQRRYEVEDHAASRNMLTGELLVGHLVPAAGRHYVAGSAAHLTEDTGAPLRAFAELYLQAFQRERPDAGWEDLIAERSELINHFVMRLPTDKAEPGLLDRIVVETRAALQLSEEPPAPEPAGDLAGA